MEAKHLEELIGEGEGGLDWAGDSFAGLRIRLARTWADAARAAANGWRLAHRDHFAALERRRAPLERMRAALHERMIDERVTDAEVLALRWELLRARRAVSDLDSALNQRLEEFMRRWRQENPEPDRKRPPAPVAQPVAAP